MKQNKKGSMSALENVMTGLGVVGGIIILILAFSFVFVSMRSEFPQVNSATLNETGAWFNSSGYTVDDADSTGFGNFAVTEARNGTSGAVIASGNYTVNSATGVVTNATSKVWGTVQLDYTYDSDGSDRLAIDTSRTGFIAMIPLLGLVLLVVVLAAIIAVVLSMYIGKRRA